MKVCVVCLQRRPRDDYSNRQWKTYKSVCALCVDQKHQARLSHVSGDDRQNNKPVIYPHACPQEVGVYGNDVGSITKPSVSSSTPSLDPLCTKRFDDSSAQEKSDASRQIDEVYDESGSQCTEAGKQTEAVLANAAHKLLNEFEYIDFFENDYITSVIEQFDGDVKLVEERLCGDVARMSGGDCEGIIY